MSDITSNYMPLFMPAKTNPRPS